MAIGTYSELQTAAANFLVRSDLVSRIPEFIQLAEARLNRVLRARLAEVERTATINSGERVVDLPAAYTEALNVWLVRSGDRVALEYRDPSLMEATDTAGEPRYWGIDGASLAFERPADQDYTVIMRLLESFALSDADPTNALLTSSPDIYLFATLCEAGPFLRDAELSANYEAKLTRAIAEFNHKNARAKAQQRLVTEPGALNRLGRYHGYDINTDFR